MLLSGNPGTETRSAVFIDGRLFSSIPELNNQTIDINYSRVECPTKFHG